MVSLQQVEPPSQIEAVVAEAESEAELNPSVAGPESEAVESGQEQEQVEAES